MLCFYCRVIRSIRLGFVLYDWCFWSRNASMHTVYCGVTPQRSVTATGGLVRLLTTVCIHLSGGAPFGPHHWRCQREPVGAGVGGRGRYPVGIPEVRKIRREITRRLGYCQGGNAVREVIGPVFALCPYFSCFFFVCPVLFCFASLVRLLPFIESVKKKSRLRASVCFASLVRVFPFIDIVQK